MSSYLDILKSLQQSPTQSSSLDHTSYQQQSQPPLLPQQLPPLPPIYSPQQSFIQYIPFKRKVIDYHQHIYKQHIPRITQITDQIQKIVIQSVPKQIVKTDYYAVQHLRYYRKETVPEKSVEYVPVVRTVKRREFVPVQRKIVHYPKDVDISLLSSGTQMMNAHDTKYSRTSLFNNNYPQTVDQKKQPPIFQSLQQKLSTLQKQSPIKHYLPQPECQRSSPLEDYISEKQDPILSASVLHSLSKAYSPESSTGLRQSKFQIDHKQSKQSRRCSRSPTRYQVFSRPITRYQQMKTLRPSTFREINCKSTQTIDSKYLKNL